MDRSKHNLMYDFSSCGRDGTQVQKAARVISTIFMHIIFYFTKQQPRMMNFPLLLLTQITKAFQHILCHML